MTAAAAVILESGDHLTRAEFHRRYCARPDIRKAELVEGVVFVASPVSAAHARAHTLVIAWLAFYLAHHRDVAVYDNVTVLLDSDNEVQPDACLIRGDSSTYLSESGYVERTPQLIVEVAASSASYDLHEKMRAYQRNGVLEYVVWRVFDETIDWFRLRDGEYVRVQPDAEGSIESSFFPGLRLNVAALLAGDLAGVRTALEG